MDSATLYRVGNFDQATVNQLAADTGSLVEAISAAGALSLNTYVSELTVSGTKAYTLAAPTFAGQRKLVRCVSAASTPAGTMTVSSPDDTAGFVCAASFFFDTAGQLIEFQATTALKWRAIRKVRTGRKRLVVGTTATTGICNMSHVDLSVTASVASTTVNALPDGSAVGELVHISCSTAASTPHGDLGGAYLKKDETAGTLLDDFTLVTDNALLQWNGAAWTVMVLAGTTLSIA